MKARAAIAGFAAVAALLCAAPGAAAAGAPPSAPSLLAGVSRLNDQLAVMGQGSTTLGMPRNRALSEIRFENRDGYAIAVVAFGQTVALSVSRRLGEGRGRVSTTTYLAHGKVTPTSIAASFGDRGRIAVRFQPSGRELRATRDAGCRNPGGGILARIGVFAGELNFRGEGGYTSAEVHRVRGRSVDFRALIACLLGAALGRDAVLPAPKSPLGLRLPGLVAELRGTSQRTPGVRTHPSDGPKSTTLLASSKSALSRTAFAAQEKGGRRAHFVAIDESSEGSVGILRTVFSRGGPDTFVFDSRLSGAAAAPPPPFSGSGALEQHGPGDAKSWTGSLAVSFLGAPHMPLTGSPFAARLAQGW